MLKFEKIVVSLLKKLLSQFLKVTVIFRMCMHTLLGLLITMEKKKENFKFQNYVKIY